MPAVFYPSAKVRFQIRFEDFLSLPPVPSVPTGDGAESFGIGIQTDVPFGAFKTVGFDLVPYTCSVEFNSYRAADTCRVSIPLRKLPFDPRIIRAATVQVFGGTFTAAEYAEAVGAPEPKGLMLPDVVPPGRSTSGESNELFRGLVDDWEIRLEGEDELTVTARDLTGVLIDAEIPPNALRDILPTLTLDQVIGQILLGDGIPTSALSRRFGLPGARGIQIVNEGGDPTPVGEAKLAAGERADQPGDREPLPTLAEIRPPSYLDSRQTAKKGRKRSPTSSQKVSYWDMITDLCVSAGFICYMRPGTKPFTVGTQTYSPPPQIVITTPRTYYGDSTTTGETVIDLSAKRVLIYGQNVGSLGIKRRLTGINVPDAVLVKSWDAAAGVLHEGRFPPASKPKTRAAPSGVGDREEVRVFELDEVTGPRATKILENAAKSIYEQLGRGEIEITVKTKHMSGFVDNIDEGIEADLFRLRPGDPVAVEISPALVEDGRVAAHTLFTGMSREERIAAMVAQGMSEPIAILAANAMDSRFIQTEFRTQRMMANWDKNSGWEFEIHAINYLDVRDAVTRIEGGI